MESPRKPQKPTCVCVCVCVCVFIYLLFKKMEYVLQTLYKNEWNTKVYWIHGMWFTPSLIENISN